MSASPDLDDVINNAENLPANEQLQLILHLAKKGGIASRAQFLLSFMGLGSMSHDGFVAEERFTGTWAYDQIWSSLRAYSTTQPGGKKGFQFRQTIRKSLDTEGAFSVDGFEFGPRDSKPVFALRMRHSGKDSSEGRLIASEIEAFFRKGVQVIWVVDVEDGCTVHVYRSTSPEQVTVYRMGEIAEADPALPGWRMAVSELPYHQDVGILSTNALSNRDAEASDILVIPGKAEIVRGVVTHFSVAGGLAGWATDQIFSSLHDYARRTNSGIAVGDNKAFLVDLPGRKSFSPNAAFYTGKMSAGYYQGAPIFAVEVMDGLDYSNEGWRRIHSKRHDYFEAGTEVVWNVDVLVSEKVWAYRRANPDEPTRYGRGDVAEAEPAVPGWTMPVDELFL